jgi:hypothetical protein
MGPLDHEGGGPWAVESDAGLLMRASGELVERLRGVQQAGAEAEASQDCRNR